MDRDSFILGMVSAFCECVAGGCKPLALSPPLTDEDYRRVGPAALNLAAEHGLIAYHEKNLDLPPEKRCHWVAVCREQAVLEAYLKLRAQGHSPRMGLEPFYGVLGYTARRVSSGYDAFHAFFPENR